jgi:hypothetical protein
MIRKGLVLFLIIGMLGIPLSYADAQQTTSLYFPETGHWVKGEFLTFYQSLPDPKAIYGLPLTEAFLDPVQNIEIQYFQKARLELHENAPAEERVQLSPLGTLTFQANKIAEVDMPTDTPQCRMLGNYSVCYAFLAFFDAHGGITQFGYPISNYAKEGDQYVQYFEKARFEFHPELDQDAWVRLTDIGRIQFDQSQRNPALLTSVRNEGNIPSQVTSLQLNAYVSDPVTKANNEEGITVVVSDQYYRPITGALGSARVIFSDSKVETYDLPATDNSGVSMIQGINVGEAPAGQVVEIEISVTYNDLQSTTTTWFRVWW